MIQPTLPADDPSDLNVTIELGAGRMLPQDIRQLGQGSVLELDKRADEPVDVFVDDRLVARGQLLLLNDAICVRVSELVAQAKEENP